MYLVTINDEAHQLNEKSGLYSNLGENPIKELIHAAKTSVFFVDPHQLVAFADIGSPETIESFAKVAGADIVHCPPPPSSVVPFLTDTCPG